jgi:hypothetical protein
MIGLPVICRPTIFIIKIIIHLTIEIIKKTGLEIKHKTNKLKAEKIL